MSALTRRVDFDDGGTPGWRARNRRVIDVPAPGLRAWIKRQPMMRVLLLPWALFFVLPVCLVVFGPLWVILWEWGTWRP